MAELGELKLFRFPVLIGQTKGRIRGRYRGDGREDAG